MVEILPSSGLVLADRLDARRVGVIDSDSGPGWRDLQQLNALDLSQRSPCTIRDLDVLSPEPSSWRDAVEDGGLSLKDAAEAALNCRACRLWKGATQTVFGQSESRLKPDLLLVGEQPGDREDLAGEPFVGPAGRVLDEALDDAGIDRRTAYLTNVVKHFSFELRGKQRIHKKPKSDEIRACRPWLEAEVSALKPKLVVCLGATAAQAVIGPSFRVTKSRGTLVSSALAPRVMATVHPSSILRASDAESRRAEMELFVADLRVAAKLLNAASTEE